MNASPVASIVRGWVELYTSGMPESLRAARRDEIDDDLWCQQEDAAASGRSAGSLAAEMFVRWLLGMPADLSWRLSHGSKSDAVRRPSMSTRVIGALAIVAGASWGLSATAVVFVGPSFMEGSNEMTARVLGIGGQIGFAAALIGLIWRFQDQTSSLGVLAGVVAAFGVLVGPLGAFLALILFPLGSAALIWELARVGVLSRLVGVIHGVSAAGILIPLVAVMMDWDAVTNAAIVAPGVPYFLSWLLIGGSLLRGVSQPREPAAGN